MASRMQSFLRVAASHQRDTERIGSLLAIFSRASANPFLNYAIPDDNATPSPADVTALMNGFPGCHLCASCGNRYTPFAFLECPKGYSGKVRWNIAPFTALGHDIKDSVEYSPQTGTTGSPGLEGEGAVGLTQIE